MSGRPSGPTPSPMPQLSGRRSPTGAAPSSLSVHPVAVIPMSRRRFRMMNPSDKTAIWRPLSQTRRHRHRPTPVPWHPKLVHPCHEYGDAQTPGQRVVPVAGHGSVLMTTKSTCRLPQPEQARRACQSGTGCLGAVALDHFARVGSTWRPQPRHHTTNRTPAGAALPRVIGGPLYPFIRVADACPQTVPYGPLAVAGLRAEVAADRALPGSP
jgi:hypothetical protein